MVNLKEHYVEEQATGVLKKVYLPCGVQLHKNAENPDDACLYLVSALRLLPQEESLRL